MWVWDDVMAAVPIDVFLLQTGVKGPLWDPEKSPILLCCCNDCEGLVHGVLHGTLVIVYLLVCYVGHWWLYIYCAVFVRAVCAYTVRL